MADARLQLVLRPIFEPLGAPLFTPRGSRSGETVVAVSERCARAHTNQTNHQAVLTGRLRYCTVQGLS